VNVPRKQFSELQNDLERVMGRLQIATDAKERKELLVQMRKLIDEAEAVVREQPSTKAFQAGASD
jgi:hypothetical protein